MKTIKMNGQDVQIMYCLATETGFEQLSKKPAADVFNPTITEYDDDGKPKSMLPAPATSDDYTKLAYAGIVAAYSRNGQQSPITYEYLLYDAKPTEIAELIKTIAELRNEWYNVPDIIKPETKPKRQSKKNS